MESKDVGKILGLSCLLGTRPLVTGQGLLQTPSGILCLPGKCEDTGPRGAPEGYWAERCTDSILATLEGKCCQPALTQTRTLRQKTKNQLEATAQNLGRALSTQLSSLANKKGTLHRRVITEDALLTHVDKNDRHKKELAKRKTSAHL